MTEVESRINESGSMNISEGVAYLISRERVSKRQRQMENEQ